VLGRPAAAAAGGEPVHEQPGQQVHRQVDRQRAQVGRRQEAQRVLVAADARVRPAPPRPPQPAGQACRTGLAAAARPPRRRTACRHWRAAQARALRLARESRSVALRPSAPCAIRPGARARRGGAPLARVLRDQALERRACQRGQRPGLQPVPMPVRQLLHATVQRIEARLWHSAPRRCNALGQHRAAHAEASASGRRLTRSGRRLPWADKQAGRPGRPSAPGGRSVAQAADLLRRRGMAGGDHFAPARPCSTRAHARRGGSASRSRQAQLWHRPGRLQQTARPATAAPLQRARAGQRGCTSQRAGFASQDAGFAAPGSG